MNTQIAESPEEPEPTQEHENEAVESSQASSAAPLKTKKRGLRALRERLPKNLAATLGILAVATVAAASAHSDLQMKLPNGSASTDDAYVRADITPLAARVEGYVARVLVNDHQRVTKGQLLVEIESADFVARVARAEARVRAAEAMVEANAKRHAVQRPIIAAAGAAREGAAVLVARDALDASRHDRLVEEGLVSKRDHERAVHDSQRALAELRQRSSERSKATAELTLLASEHQRLEAELNAARAELELARIELSWTRIVAPMDGVVGERGVREGQLVRDGTQIIQFVAIDNVWVTANFKEKQMAGLRPGHAVTLTIDGFPQQHFRGVVDSVAPASGAQMSLLPPDNATGNFTKIAQRVPVKVTFDTPANLAGLLVPGMSALVELDDGRPQ